MTTAREIIEAAARLIGVKRTGLDLQQNEYENALEILNDIITELQSFNIKFRFTLIKTYADIDTKFEMQDWVNSYIKTQLAIDLAPEYSLEASPSIQNRNRVAYNRLCARITDLNDVQKPVTMPKGSGNNYLGRGNNDKYYKDKTKNAIATDSDSIIFDDEGHVLDKQPTYKNKG